MKRDLRSFAQLLLLVVFLMGSHASFGQGKGNPDKKKIPQAALEHIKKNRQKFRLNDKEIANLELSSETRSKHNGLRHIYLKQTYEGIEIHGAVSNINMTKDGKVLSMGNRFKEDVERKVNATKPEIDASAAVAAAARYLNTSIKGDLSVIEKGDARKQEVVFTTAGISLEPIPAKLVYQPMEDGSFRLAWEISIYELGAENWWNIRMDAITGAFLGKDNMVAQCLFDNNGAEGSFLHENHGHTPSAPYLQEQEVIPFALEESIAAKAKTPGLYDVYPVPVESPIHGNRKPTNARAEESPLASPDGWHTAGETSYTITRGNNVYAYEDPDNTGYVGGPQDMYGYSPDGGIQRVFKYPIDFSKDPVAYRDAAITNLFYWNNMIHDVWYNYGFDEASGNFQTVNFDRGGAEGDHVMAEAQDSRNIPTTRNNANFATPPDGIRPRMQMYLWTRPDLDMFQVISPSSIAGTYRSSGATFGPPLTPEPLTGKLVLAVSGADNLGCEAITNAEAVNGNIAVLYRGVCAFVQKVQNAQAAGAIAVVVINNQPGSPITMGGVEDPENPIEIPSVMITDEAGATIREQMEAGEAVTVSLKNDPNPDVDGDFDNGIIVHEYGHGISNRLTGGPDVTYCLGNAEQAGEGWSDWFGLMMTMKRGDTAEKIRGIGTYAVGDPTDGMGIRPAPYSTDFSVNGYTYAATNNPAISQPHGVGFVFATVLWEMTWDLIDEYGYDKDLYNGNGGNNMAMQLVIDGLKLQPCYPGFVDARDAILLADELNYGGANQELIWRAFARRGLGFSASQGSSFSRTDQTEAFDMPAMYSSTIASTAVDFSLKAVPNPFGSSSRIEFTTPTGGTYRLEIRDRDGLLIRVLTEGISKAGESHAIEFNRGSLSNGIYVARLVTDKESKIARIVLE
jgi:extracellular elastinolytic metalloproteinase